MVPDAMDCRAEKRTIVNDSFRVGQATSRQEIAMLPDRYWMR